MPALARWGLDFPSGAAQPRAWRFVVATVVAVGLSIAACAALVAVGIRVFPSTAGHPSDAITTPMTVSLVIASLGWPAACYVSTRARRLYLVLAVLVSIAALAPDAWILYQGQSAQAVLVLVWMHGALAVVTYLSMVLIAPQRTPPRRASSTGTLVP